MLFVRNLVCFVAGLSVVADASTVYPASFPYENEKADLLPPDLLAATPSFEFDSKDPGGYVYTAVYQFILTGDLLPTCAALEGFAAAYLNSQGFPPELPKFYFNCTRATVYDENFFPGTYGTYKSCEPGECCQSMWGVMAGGDSLNTELLVTNTDKSDVGNCPPLPEQAYCVIFSVGLFKNCMEQWVTETERLTIGPCPDSFYNWVMSCTLYKLTGQYDENWESETYISLSSPEQNTLWYYSIDNPDKICHPQSYYDPSYAKSAESSSTSGSSPALESDESESSAWKTIGVFLFVVLSLVF